MNKATVLQVSRALDQFMTNGEAIECVPYGNGHINNTYRAVCRNAEGKDTAYILQQVNTGIFKQAGKLMESIYAVTTFLRKKESDERRVMTVVPTKEGKAYYIDEAGQFWRVFVFVTDSVCIERPSNPSEFYECAYAFGKFQRDLSDFPAETLFETIPDFHNTPKRYETFLKAVEEDVCGRAAGVQKEIEFVKARADFYPVLINANKAGELPLRVTHNDTKCNNVLLDDLTRKGLCVVDLDTVMPGFSVTDFGDSIRFGANTAAEDEQDLSRVRLDMDLFEAYAKGFLEGCDGKLLNSEIMLMPEGAKMMTVECGMRFLTDYLQGDTYFKTAYDTHNLVRCRTQFKLVEEMEAHWDEMKEIVKYFCR